MALRDVEALRLQVMYEPREDLARAQERWKYLQYQEVPTEPRWVKKPEDSDLLCDVLIETMKHWDEFKSVEALAHRMRELEKWLSAFELDTWLGGSLPSLSVHKIDYAGIPEHDDHQFRDAYSEFNIDLRGFDFSTERFVSKTTGDAKSVQFLGVCLDGATFYRSDFYKSKFYFCSLVSADLNNASFKGASFYGSDLTASRLSFCHLESANLSQTILRDTDLTNVYFDGSTRVDRETTFVGPSREKKIAAEKSRKYGAAAEAYGIIKKLYVDNGMMSESNEFLYREYVCRRKSKWWLGRFIDYCLLNLTSKYALSPLRCLVTASLLILSWTAYYRFRFEEVILPESFADSPLNRLMASFHFSVSSFSTVGFGDISPKTGTLTQLVSNLEGVAGIIVMALFVASLVRKLK